MESRNLNIHYSAPAFVWEKLKDVYRSMPNWKGYINGFPYWFGGPDSDRYLTVSVEPSGLQVLGSLDDEEFEKWFLLLRKKLTKALEYEVGEPEEGFEFNFYE